MQFGVDYGVVNKTGQVKISEIAQILSEAKKNGIRILDTAIAYGTSEKVLGEAGVKEFRVVTKLPSAPANVENIERWVVEQVIGSLARLRQERLYGLLLHQPQDLLGSKGAQLTRALIDLKARDLVEKIGVSIYSPEELSEICRIIKIDLVQAPLNVIDRRLQSSGWLDRLKDDCIEIHARSAFLQGLLLTDREKIPQNFLRWSYLWDQWHEKIKFAGFSTLAACLDYPLSLKQVDRVVLGVNSTAQFLEILQALDSDNDIPDTSFMSCMDLDLINPTNWNRK